MHGEKAHAITNLDQTKSVQPKVKISKEEERQGRVAIIWQPEESSQMLIIWSETRVLINLAHEIK